MKCIVLPQYGFFSSALEKLVRRRFGDDKWEEICDLAGVSLGESCSFQVHHVYEEKDIHSLLQTATTVLGLDQPTILEMFGEQFLQWCVEYGQSETLRLLGRSLQDFLANLDSLHDHVSTIYPHMVAPSFRCSPGRWGDEFLLHYHSQRDGLEPLVIGLVKAVARQYFKMEVRIELMTKKGDEGSDHSVFTVQEVAHYEQSPTEEALRCSTPRVFPDQPLVTPEVFCKSFPFHVVFNRNMEILQCGSTLSVLLSGALQKDPNISSHFTIDHPLIKFTFVQYFLTLTPSLS
ncbi:Guanylate cyclase soluble subunit beta-1 [Geodia barretti]|uniref:guanylate cyclase n=1 Tax=Geodia barretti TaxID=519541 RepID=A0AA35U1X6_GEOBA|nr:Guanylate cyclase soluble subunit beta-1 [Geodia barretti]